MMLEDNGKLFAFPDDGLPRFMEIPAVMKEVDSKDPSGSPVDSA